MAEAAIETIGLISGIMGIVDFTEGLVPDKPAEGTVVRIKAGLGSALDDTGGWVGLTVPKLYVMYCKLTLNSGWSN